MQQVLFSDRNYCCSFQFNCYFNSTNNFFFLPLVREILSLPFVMQMSTRYFKIVLRKKINLHVHIDV